MNELNQIYNQKDLLIFFKKIRLNTDKKIITSKIEENKPNKSDNLKTYGKATSPIVDNVSKVNQLLIHKHLFDHLDDKIEHNVDEELGEVVKKLNLSKKEQNIKE